MNFPNLTEFLQHQASSLGTFYEVTMLPYSLLLTSTWLLYLTLCLFSHLFANKRFTLSKSVGMGIRHLIDSLFNPVFPLAYYLLTTYVFHQASWIHLLQYQHPDGSTQPYVAPTLFLMLAGYTLWIQLHKIFLSKHILRFDYHHTYIRHFFSPSRLFGASAPFILLINFDKPLMHLLWLQLYLGIFFAVCAYLYGSYTLYLQNHTADTL